MTRRKLSLAGRAPLRRLVRESIARSIELAPEGELVETLAFELSRALRREAGVLNGFQAVDVETELASAGADLVEERHQVACDLAEAQDELALHQTMLDDAHGAMIRRADAEAPALDAALAAELNALFQRAAEGSLSLEELRTATFARVQERAVVARQAMLEAWSAERDKQVDLLRRRLDKVNRTLEASEAALMRLAAERGVDPGIASIYRAVQGLDLMAPDAARKRLLLAEIYRANVALREQRTPA